MAITDIYFTRVLAVSKSAFLIYHDHSSAPWPDQQLQGLSSRKILRVLRAICHQKALLAIKDSYFTRLLEISKYAFVIYSVIRKLENFDVLARYFIKLLKRPAAGDFFFENTYSIFKRFLSIFGIFV